MSARYSRAILVAAASLAGALANWDDTSTGIDLDKLPRFPMTRTRSGFLKIGERVTFDGISATAGEAEVRLRGRGKARKPWEVRLCSTCFDEVWRGDLDGNGTLDYVFSGSGPYTNGRTTPLYSLSILLMDGEGLPVPFFTVVYHGENGNGVKQLVDLDHDGRAELLISTYDERQSDPQATGLTSGHFVPPQMEVEGAFCR